MLLDKLLSIRIVGGFSGFYQKYLGNSSDAGATKYGSIIGKYR